jgi:hypothetical protein
MACVFHTHHKFNDSKGTTSMMLTVTTLDLFCSTSSTSSNSNNSNNSRPLPPPNSTRTINNENLDTTNSDASVTLIQTPPPPPPVSIEPATPVLSVPNVSSTATAAATAATAAAAAAAAAAAERDAIEFQIRATLSSWSFTWNRGDIVGYCDGYTPTASYVSISATGQITQRQGKEDITTLFTNIFRKCQKYQTKLDRLQQQPLETSTSLSHNGNTNDAATVSKSVAGYMEYSNIQIQMTNDTITNNAVAVVGQYRLEFTPLVYEQGVFTLHVIQNLGIWRIQSEHSSAIGNDQHCDTYITLPK